VTGCDWAQMIVVAKQAQDNKQFNNKISNDERETRNEFSA